MPVLLCRQGQPETDDSIFLMYSSFFQPLIREVLPGVMRQLLMDERQVQVRRGGGLERGGRSGRYGYYSDALADEGRASMHAAQQPGERWIEREEEERLFAGSGGWGC